ncbi:hypothetical protein [Sphingomonas oligophenolica]
MLEFAADFLIYYQHVAGDPAVIEEQRDNSEITAAITAGGTAANSGGIAGNSGGRCDGAGWPTKTVMSKSRAEPTRHAARSRSPTIPAMIESTRLIPERRIWFTRSPPES